MHCKLKKWLLRVSGIFDTRDTVLMTLKTWNFRQKCAEAIKNALCCWTGSVQIQYTCLSFVRFCILLQVFLIKTTNVPLNSYQIKLREIL